MGAKKVLTDAETTVTATGSECTSSFDVYEHNVESLALEVIGQNWSGENCCSLSKRIGNLRGWP